MTPKALPLPLEEELFLKQSTQQEKILYILWKNGITRQDKVKVINEQLPGIIRKSSRTLYKAYNHLILGGKIKKVKELENERKYFAYKLTSEGEEWLTTELQGIKIKIQSVPIESAKKIASIDTTEKDNTKSQLGSSSINEKSTQQTSLDTALQRESNKKNTNPMQRAPVDPSSSDNLHIFKRLTDVLEKIERRLDSPVTIHPSLLEGDISQNQENDINHLAEALDAEIIETKNYSASNISEENLVGEPDPNALDDDIPPEVLEEEDTSVFSSLQTKSNLELLEILKNALDDTNLQNTILNKIIFTRAHSVEEKIKLYISLSNLFGKSEELREALIHDLKLGEEDIQKYVSILTLTHSEEEEEAIWEIISPKTLQNDTKTSIFIHLLCNSRNLNYNRIQRIIRLLQLKGEILVDFIEKPKEYKISHSIVLILLDIMANQLVVQRSMPWDLSLDFSFWGESITKKQFVVYFIEQSFLSGIYNRTRAMIELLKQQQEFTIAEAQIELLILLNLQNYPELENRIQEYEILTNKAKIFDYQEELGFIAFRTFYEQKTKLKEIALNPDFDKKWKLIAKLEKDLTQEGVMWIDESDIKSILARLSPLYNEQYRLFPTRPLAIFYQEHLVEENVLLYFTPHFTRWLHTQGDQGEKDAIRLLHHWWDNRFRVIQFLNLQEEILHLLAKWDRELKVKWTTEIKRIREGRDQMRNLL